MQIKDQQMSLALVSSLAKFINQGVQIDSIE